jgi:hypothetical protein
MYRSVIGKLSLRVGLLMGLLLGLSLLLLVACGGQDSSEAQGRAKAFEKANINPLVGDWRRIRTCDEYVHQLVGLTRFRRPIRVKRSGSVKGVEEVGQERQALLA